MPKFRIYTPVELDSGYGVWFSPIFGAPDTPEEDTVVEVYGGIVEISPDTVKVATNVEPYVEVEQYCHMAATSFRRYEDLQTDDTHDLRNRLFDTKQEARQHLEHTLETFNNPLPWQTFIRF